MIERINIRNLKNKGKSLHTTHYKSLAEIELLRKPIFS